MYGNKRKAPPARKLSCPINWAPDNKPRVASVIETRLMNAEYISGLLLDLFNTGYPEAMKEILDSNIEYIASFRSRQHPLLKPGEVYKPQHFFCADKFIGMLSVLGSAIPDFYKFLNVSKEGLEIYLRTSATGTVVSYAELGEVAKATDVLSEDAVNRSSSISVQHEMRLSLNTFNRIQKFSLTFWMTGEKLDENGFPVGDDE